MRCTSPRTVGFLPDGKTLCWSSKHYSKQYATFQLPCGKCIECRLDYSRQWAIRCIHEAQMHERNSFITLTYSDEKLKSDKLIYEDFQKFMKKVRKTQNEPIGVFVTGEYGEKNKRPHWHAILFNYSPTDAKPKYKTIQGHQVWESDNLEKLWGHGIAEFGSVTLESAGYCARYAAKKLVHGKDDEHEFEPISKKSSKHAIGKKWLEKYWPDVFLLGHMVLPNGQTSSIPRYYEKWLKKNKPDEWNKYVTKTKTEITRLAQERSEKDYSEWAKAALLKPWYQPAPLTLNQVRELITKSKFKLLQNSLKL